MKIAFYYTVGLIAIQFCSAPVWGADVTLLNGDIELTISAATAGQQPDATSTETCQLQWTTLLADATKKITVQTSLATPSFTLTVSAVSVSAGDGTATGSVTLSTSAADLIENIPAGVLVADPGTCTLHYAASATAAQGAGSESHTITFTIADQ